MKNNFIGKIDKYQYFHELVLTGIKFINKEEYTYVFYTFVDKEGNTIIAKERKIWFISYIEYTCAITGTVVRNQTNELFDKLVKVEIKDGVIHCILDRNKMTDVELLHLKSTHFSGNRRVNFYNPKTYEVYCFTGENKRKELEVGDIIKIIATVKKHTTFKGVNQTIINILEVKEIK